MQTWKPEEDQRLLDMRAAGAMVSLIAKVVNRSEAATTGRLIAFGSRRRQSVEQSVPAWPSLWNLSAFLFIRGSFLFHPRTLVSGEE